MEEVTAICIVRQANLVATCKLVQANDTLFARCIFFNVVLFEVYSDQRGRKGGLLSNNFCSSCTRREFLNG